jgi:hypothetical protein
MSFKLHLAVRQHPVSDVSRTTVGFTSAAVTLSVRHVLSEVDITVNGLAAGNVMGMSLTVLLLLLYITIFINSNISSQATTYYVFCFIAWHDVVQLA